MPKAACTCDTAGGIRIAFFVFQIIVAEVDKPLVARKTNQRFVQESIHFVFQLLRFFTDGRRLFTQIFGDGRDIGKGFQAGTQIEQPHQPARPHLGDMTVALQQCV